MSLRISDTCDAQYEAVGEGVAGGTGVLAYVRRDSCISCSHGLFWAWIGLKVRKKNGQGTHASLDLHVAGQRVS